MCITYWIFNLYNYILIWSDIQHLQIHKTNWYSDKFYFIQFSQVFSDRRGKTPNGLAQPFKVAINARLVSLWKWCKQHCLNPSKFTPPSSYNCVSIWSWSLSIKCITCMIDIQLLYATICCLFSSERLGQQSYKSLQRFYFQCISNSL